ncbi:MAG: 2-dehydro-3-deoxygalactonokinase [Planctomycetota bacterium]
MRRYFLSCDWGTSNFRLAAVDPEAVMTKMGSSKTIAERSSDRGIRDLTESGSFGEYLAAEIAALLEESNLPDDGSPVWVSGMASSTIGWHELEYAALPFDLDGTNCVYEAIRHSALGNREAYLVSGIRAEADVLRGEESQILGVFSHPEYRRFRSDASLVLPGTHSKHVSVSHETVDAFQSFISGELFELLRHQSVLRHSVHTESVNLSSRETRDAFLRGVRCGRDSSIAPNLFRVRAEQVLDGETAANGTAFLSGLILGDEIARSDVLREDRPVLLCASGPLLESYTAAFTEFSGLDVITIPSSVSETAVARGQLVIQTRVQK